MNIPLKITAGFAVEWEDQLSLYPSPEYTLYYKIINEKNSFTLEGTATDGVTKFTLGSVFTKSLTPGSYRVFLIAVKNNDSYDAGKSFIEVLPDPLNANNIDYKSNSQKILDAIEAVIHKRADKIQRSYQIAGRSLEYMSFDDLIRARAYFINVVEQEKQHDAIMSGKRTKSNNVLLRFVKS